VPWWRDQSEPPLQRFLQLDKLMDSFLTPGTSPCALVHCAGGIGRAGVFIAADAGGRAALRGEAHRCSPDRLIGHLRQCRMNMVQTAEQYEFLHRALPLLVKQMRAGRDANAT
ncbi:PTPRR, partial [Symbiodinium pilosum]